mmetsp:Transcript_22583/g.52356  ORF Transcript_22583/g.52356 Transcript_22583/m.52356 type:complete len:242 (-) Transcript_22583:447-1172(-)
MEVEAVTRRSYSKSLSSSSKPARPSLSSSPSPSLGHSDQSGDSWMRLPLLPPRETCASRCPRISTKRRYSSETNSSSTTRALTEPPCSRSLVRTRSMSRYLKCVSAWYSCARLRHCVPRWYSTGRRLWSLVGSTARSQRAEFHMPKLSYSGPLKTILKRAGWFERPQASHFSLDRSSRELSGTHRPRGRLFRSVSQSFRHAMVPRMDSPGEHIIFSTSCAAALSWPWSRFLAMSRMNLSPF